MYLSGIILQATSIYFDCFSFPFKALACEKCFSNWRFSRDAAGSFARNDLFAKSRGFFVSTTLNKWRDARPGGIESEVNRPA
jgi:hypothetical protein